MRHSGEHLLSLINDLLDMSKIEAGNHKLTLSRFDFESMLNSVIEIVHSKAVDKGLQLKLQIESLQHFERLLECMRKLMKVQ